MITIKNNIITYLISAVWLVNGLFCKVLNMVPRHQEIVARILSNTYAPELIMFIGFAEVLMVIWILSGFQFKLNAITQIVIVLIMNSIEFYFASDVLLWGGFNFVFAVLFVSLVYYNAFFIHKTKDKYVIS